MANEGMQQQDQATPLAKPSGETKAEAPKRDALAVAPQSSEVTSPFSGGPAFANAQRMATSLAASSLVPQVYRGNVANCLIAMELASRIGVSVLAAMQNLDVIQGKPSWSSKFLIATVNASGRFTPLRFEWGGEVGKDSWACRAHAKDRETNERLDGPWITMLMAKREGWATKSGSKWQTMPELMFMYRSAAFWSRIYAPEISVGFQTAEEAEDVARSSGDSPAALPEQLSPGGAKSLEAVLGMQEKAADAPIDAEIVEDEPGQPTREPEPAKAKGKSEQSKLPGT